MHKRKQNRIYGCRVRFLSRIQSKPFGIERTTSLLGGTEYRELERVVGKNQWKRLVNTQPFRAVREALCVSLPCDFPLAEYHSPEEAEG